MDAEKLHEMIEEVSTILMIYGYEVDPASSDRATIQLFLNRNANYINQQCNTTVVPDGLLNLLIDRATADFLELKMTQNALSIDGMDFTTQSIKSYSGGDVSVTYADSFSQSDSFKKIIKSLRGDDAIFAQYRRIKW